MVNTFSMMERQSPAMISAGLLAVSLLGDDAAVHEHGAAAAQHGRAVARKRPSGRSASTGMSREAAKFSRKEPQPEEQASFTTMLVMIPVVQPDGLHVLAADVQNEGGVRHILWQLPGRGPRSPPYGTRRKRLWQRAAPRSRWCPPPGCPARAPCFLDSRSRRASRAFSGHLQGLALVGGSRRSPGCCSSLVHQHEFGGGAARVDAQIGRDTVLPPVWGRLPGAAMLGVAWPEKPPAPHGDSKEGREAGLWRFRLLQSSAP